MSYLRYVASATRAAAGGSRSEPDRYRSGHTRQGCHLHTNHRKPTSYLPSYVNADSGDWRGCALIVFNIYGDGRALNRSAQRTLVCLSLSLSESVRIAADRVSTHKAVFLSQRITNLKRKPLAVTLTGRSRLPILNIPFVPILCTCLCMACC